MRLLLQFRGAMEGKLLHLGAAAFAVRPEAQECSDFLDRKAEVPGLGDKREPREVFRGVNAISTGRAFRTGEQLYLFIVPNHPLRNAYGLRYLPDVHSDCRFSRRALVTTLTDDSAMAAAAIIGESRMPKTGYRSPAAIGTPAAL